MANIRLDACGKWLARVRKNGFTASKMFKTKEDAELWAANQEAAINHGHYQPIVNDKKAGHSVSAVLIKYIEEELKDTRKYNQKISVLRRIAASSLGKKRMADLSSGHINSFIKARKNEVSDSTALREVQTLSGVLKFARESWEYAGVMPVNPCLDAAKPKAIVKTPTEFVEDSTLKIVCAEIRNGDVRRALLFLHETAMRRGELCQLQWEDYLKDDGLIFIPEAKAKTNKDRIIPLSPQAVAVLAEIAKAQGSTPPDRRIFEMQPGSITQAVTRAKERINTRRKKAKKDEAPIRFRTHWLRGTQLTKIVEKSIENNISLPEVQSISGHKDARTLEKHYLKIQAEQLKKKLGY